MSQAVGLRAVDLRMDFPAPDQGTLSVLRGVNLTISGGQSLAILGPSGSGKSTLLGILAALHRPTSGGVFIGDTDIFALSAKALSELRRKRIGLVFQFHYLLPQCTALENVLLPCLAGGRAGDADIARAAQLLKRVGLDGRESYRPDQLSGGQRQRVAIARAIFNQPDVLLCDEPTGNLDAATAAQAADLLLSLVAEHHLILVAATHSTDLASRFARKAQLVDGVLKD